MNQSVSPRSALLEKTLNATLLSQRWPIALASLLALGAVLILAGIGLRGMWAPDEPRFADVAREMVVTGQWFFPARGEEFYPDKPPVFMWVIAALFKLIGNIEVAALLPNAVCSLVTLGLVFDIGRRVWSTQVGRNAALLLLITPQFLIQAKFAQIDAMVSCWITFACYGLLRHFFDGPNWRWYFVAWAFMGLGIITKGVGFLPLLMLFPLGFYHYRTKALTPSWKARLAYGPAAMLGVIGLWLVPMVIWVAINPSEEAIAYRNNILFRQTAERYVHSLGHQQPWYYFVVEVIPFFWFPLSFLVLTQYKQIKQGLRLDAKAAVLLVWVASVVVFFSISPGKRGVYLLPALPMLCLAIAAVWPSLALNKLSRGILRGAVFLVVLLAVFLAFAVVSDHASLAKALRGYNITPELRQQVGIALWGIAATLGVWFLLTVRLSPWLGYGGQVCIIALSASLLVYPLINDLRTPRELMAKLERTVGRNAEVGLVDFKEQLLLYSAKDLTHFSYLSTEQEQEQQAWWWLSESPSVGDEPSVKRYVLIPDLFELACFDRSNAVNLGLEHRTSWYLFSTDAMRPDCPQPAKLKRFHSPANQALTFGINRH